MAKASINSQIPEHITSIKINFFTPDLPPPFSYAYSLSANFSKNDLFVDFSITYTDRDDIEEEEILAEGYSMNDDQNLKVSLSKAWIDAFNEQVRKTSWRKKKKEAPLSVRITGLSDNDEFEGTPSDLASWEYFLQELMQGIFEAGKKERPLEVQYREVKEGFPDLNIMLQASFQNRTVNMVYERDTEHPHEANLEWKALKKLLKNVFLPDYHPDLAEDLLPSAPGKYINSGDGLWYAFGSALTNPGKGVDSLAILEKQFKEGLS